MELFATKDPQGKDLSFNPIRGLPWREDVQLLDKDTGQPVSLAGITELWMRVRAHPDDAEAVMELNLASTRLVIVDEDNGIYGVRCTAEQTLEFPRKKSLPYRLVSDSVIERTPGIYEPGLAAPVNVQPQVTKPLEP